MSHPFESARRWITSAAVLAACLMALHVPGVTAQSQTDLDKRFLEAWSEQPRVAVNVPSGGAKVVIVKFNDWMCPGCRIWYQQLEPILAKYRATPGAIKYVDMDWPWNAECNAAVRQTIPGHEASCAAAAAVRLAADRGKRQAMVDWLYANQPQTPAQRQAMPDRVKAKVAEVLGITDFAAAYASKLPEIKKDISAGMTLRVQSTPTYFINGVRAAAPDGTIPAPHYLELAIRSELTR